MNQLEKLYDLHQQLAEKVAKGEPLGILGEAMLAQIGNSPAFRDLVARKRSEMDEQGA